MRKRTKRNIVLSAALSLLLWGGVCENSVFAGYQDPGKYTTSINGNSGGVRQDLSGKVDSYHFSNLHYEDDININGGALMYTGGWGFDDGLYNSLFENNSAASGGAVNVNGSVAKIANSKFMSNRATYRGGALFYNANGSFISYQVDNSFFKQNHAGTYGGAAYISGNPFLTYITNTDFEGNTAGQLGGALYVDLKDATGSVRIESNDGTEHYFRNNKHNTEDQYGSEKSNAIYIASGTVELKTQNNANSKLTIDDGISGTIIDIQDSHGNVIKREYKGKLNIVSNGGGEIALNNTVKNVILTHKSGTLLLNHGNKLADGNPILDNVNLVFNPDGNDDIRFDLQNGKLDTLNIRNLTIKEPAGEQKLVVAIDVDLKQGKSDFFNISEQIDGVILFDSDHFELNILADGDADKFQLLNRGDSSFFKGENVQFNDLSKYIFSVGEDGYINVERLDSSGLPEAVAAEGIREYKPSTLDGTVVGSALGVMGGESLKINMLGSDLNGGKNEGITMNAGQKLEFKNVGTTDGAKSLNNFRTTGNGAVVNNNGGEVIITDSTVKNNVAEGKGGAIYSNGGTVTLNAQNRDVVFKENVANNNANTPSTKDGSAQAPLPTVAGGNDIYLENAVLNVQGARNTVIESGIAGSGTINKNDAGTLKLAGDNSGYTGDVNYNGGVVQLQKGAQYFNAQNTSFSNGAKLDLVNGSATDNVNLGNLTLNGDAKIGIDANLANGTGDKINAADVKGDGKIVIDNINVISTSKAQGEFSVITLDENGNSPLLGKVEIAGGNSGTAMSPIYKYQTQFNPETGVVSMAGGGKTSDGYNPSVLASPVATLLGGYLTQLNSYDMAFNNMDLYMLLTREERQALKYANKYASSRGGIYSPIMTPYEEGNTWFKPYSNFERVRLQRGPRVSNVSYGTFFGHDSDIKELANDTDFIWSVYGGYNGSHQAYKGQSIYQNGGTLGATGVLYKGNGYLGATVNAGANAAKADITYGDDDFAMFMTGVAIKTGYNGEFFKSKLIIQPNYMMSYSFVDTFDYTNAAGVKLHTKPLNAIQFRPGLRIIGNCPKGWKPYIGASIVWNVLDEAAFKANDVSLPELSIKPYVNYGLGLQKNGERFGGFFQTMFRSGGRDGISLQAGFNIAM